MTSEREKAMGVLRFMEGEAGSYSKEEGALRFALSDMEAMAKKEALELAAAAFYSAVTENIPGSRQSVPAKELHAILWPEVSR